MSRSKLSKTTGYLLLRKYVYLPTSIWYKLTDISNEEGLSESEMLEKLIREAYRGSNSEKEYNERRNI